MEKEFLFNVLDREGNVEMIIQYKNNKFTLRYPKYEMQPTILKSRKEFTEMDIPQIAMLVYAHSEDEYKRFEKELIDYKGWSKNCNCCGRLFISSNNKSKYCPKCKEIGKKVYNISRKSNKCRYLHKRICDRLSYLKIDTEAFRLESNYYWDVINDRNTEFNTSYDSSIRTESDYYEWLNYTLNSLKNIYSEKN